MSTEKEAIEHIETISAASRQIPDTDFPAAVLPEHVRIHDLQKFQEYRNRFTGTMSTSLISEFAAYTNLHEGEQVFIDPNNMTAVAFFNLGDVGEPGHGDWRAKVKLEKTAPFTALLKAADGEPMSQKRLAEFLEDWRDCVKVIDEDDKNMALSHAINAVRKVTLEERRGSEHEENTFGRKRSGFEEIEANRENKLPAKIAFTCDAPYRSLDSRTFALRVSLLTGAGEPYFTLRIVQLEQHEEEMAEEFRLELREALKENIETYIGTFSL